MQTKAANHLENPFFEENPWTHKTLFSYPRPSTLTIYILQFLIVTSLPLQPLTAFQSFQELFPGSKYKFKNENDSYQLIIMNPKVEDTGKYTIEISGVSCTAFLNVDDPDPCYSFVKPLKKKYDGFTKHETQLECTVSSSMATVGWYKGTTKLEDGDKYSISKDIAGVCRLTLKNCILEDAGEYSCKLEKQPDKTTTNVNIVEYPYKFVKILKHQQHVEKDDIVLLCELDDAGGDVKWYKGDQEIKPDKRLRISKEGRKRKLVIKDAKVTDAGMYSCVSNADKTEAEIIVNCKYFVNYNYFIYIFISILTTILSPLTIISTL